MIGRLDLAGRWRLGRGHTRCETLRSRIIRQSPIDALPAEIEYVLPIDDLAGHESGKGRGSRGIDSPHQVVFALMRRCGKSRSPVNRSV